MGMDKLYEKAHRYKMMMFTFLKLRYNWHTIDILILGVQHDSLFVYIEK